MDSLFPLICFLLSGFYNFLAFPRALGISRLFDTYNQITLGNLDMATSSRLTESSAAISILINNPLRLIAGAGIGAFFYPWSSTIGYYDYISYYAHIAPISFLWIGGITFVLNVYIFFFHCFSNLLLLVCRSLNLNRYSLFLSGFGYHAQFLFLEQTF